MIQNPPGLELSNVSSVRGSSRSCSRSSSVSVPSGTGFHRPATNNETTRKMRSPGVTKQKTQTPRDLPAVEESAVTIRPLSRTLSALLATLTIGRSLRLVNHLKKGEHVSAFNACSSVPLQRWKQSVSIDEKKAAVCTHANTPRLNIWIWLHRTPLLGGSTPKLHEAGSASVLRRLSSPEPFC